MYIRYPKIVLGSSPKGKESKFFPLELVMTQYDNIHPQKSNRNFFQYVKLYCHHIYVAYLNPRFLKKLMWLWYDGKENKSIRNFQILVSKENK
jgi:hypothetical protein